MNYEQYENLYNTIKACYQNIAVLMMVGFAIIAGFVIIAGLLLFTRKDK